MTWTIKVSQKFGLTRLSENERRLALNLYDLPPEHAKQYTRDRLIRTIIETIKLKQKGQIKILTLPGAWWRFEKSLRHEIRARKRSWRASFLSFEKNIRLFQMASSMILVANKPLKVKYSEECNAYAVGNGRDAFLVNGDVHDYLSKENHRDQRFRAIWLDLSSPYSEKIQKSISNIYEKWYVPNQSGVFAITVLCGRESLKIGGKMRDYGDRIQWLVKDIQQLIGVKSLLLYALRHQTIKTTMLHMVFKIEAKP